MLSSVLVMLVLYDVFVAMSVGLCCVCLLVVIRWLERQMTKEWPVVEFVYQQIASHLCAQLPSTPLNHLSPSRTADDVQNTRICMTRTTTVSRKANLSNLCCRYRGFHSAVILTSQLCEVGRANCAGWLGLLFTKSCSMSSHVLPTSATMGQVVSFVRSLFSGLGLAGSK